MPTPEIVLCINQSWGCRLNQTYEVLDHWTCPCNNPHEKGLIEIKGERSMGKANPMGIVCHNCMKTTPNEVWHYFPSRWFVPISGPAIEDLETDEPYEDNLGKHKQRTPETVK